MPKKKQGGEIDLGIMDEATVQGMGIPQRVVIDTQDQPGTVARDAAQPEASQQQLEVCLREFGFQALTAEEFIQAGIDELNHALVRACRAGVAFWAAKEALKNSGAPGALVNFQDWIAEKGLQKERVYECIRIAKFYARLPDDKRTQALAIGKKQAMLLASLPQEVIDQAAESGNDLIEKADLMTLAELKEEIQTLKRREKNYEAQIERAQSMVKRLSESKKRTTDFLLRTEEIREECLALQKEAELPMNALQTLFEAVNGESPDLPEWRLQIEQVWVAAHVVGARAMDLIARMKARVQADDMPDHIQGTHILTADEAQRWLLDYPMIENRHAAEAALRQEKREAARPRGPGRPKGSTNKANEG